MSLATVTLNYSGAPSPAPSGMTDGNGTIFFDSSIAPGLTNGLAVNFTVAVNDCFGRTATQTVTLSSDGGSNPVTVVMNAAPRGAISGIVTDSTSNALAQVLVTVTDANNNTVSSTVTVMDGAYSINNLETCTYDVSFALSGYQTTTVSGVVVTDGETTTENAVLTP
jgi:hypothetical protein